VVTQALVVGHVQSLLLKAKTNELAVGPGKQKPSADCTFRNRRK